MKILSALIAFLIGSNLSVSGQQWITTGTNISNTNTGNVGIGTASPGSAQLQVAKSTGGTIAITTNGASGTDANPLTPSLDFLGYWDGTKARIRALERTYNGYGSSLIFSVKSNVDATTMTDVMTLKHNGNVGIGTQVPSNLLHVYSNLATEVDVAKFQNSNSSGFVGVQIDRSFNFRYALLKYSTSGTNEWMVGTAYDGGIPNSAYSIGTGNSLSDAKLTILTDGKIGIGNTTPLAKLDVSGNIYCRNTLYIGTPDAVTTATQISGYALAVNGTAIFNKAKVKLYGNWPDYVFDDKYNLLPLPKVEKFLKINKHLPDVPTKAEIEKDGIDLGNNQTILLQKIEELTLYAIDQNKQIFDLDKKIINQQEQINVLIQEVAALKAQFKK